MKHAIAAALAIGCLATPALAATTIANTVFVEREREGARVLEPAQALRPGDKLVYVVSWKARDTQRAGLTITNPLPRSVAWQRSANGSEDVSVDGGRSWGKLEALKVRDGGRWRQALPEDVTHVRWQVPRQVALIGSGRVTWSGIVR